MILVPLLARGLIKDVSVSSKDFLVGLEGGLKGLASFSLLPSHRFHDSVTNKVELEFMTSTFNPPTYPTWFLTSCELGMQQVALLGHAVAVSCGNLWGRSSIPSSTRSLGGISSDRKNPLPHLSIVELAMKLKQNPVVALLFH